MTRYAYSPGLKRQVAVKTLDTPGAPTKAKPHQQEEPFAIVPLSWAEKMAKASKSPAVIVCTHLLYLSWKTKSQTVALSNDGGVNRKGKDRVLRNLEEAGMVRVKRHGGRSPRVTTRLDQYTTILELGVIASIREGWRRK
jgi:hypothetical protein